MPPPRVRYRLCSTRRSTLGIYTKVYPPPSYTDFVSMVRSRDQRYRIKEELLEDIYEAIRQDRLLGPKVLIPWSSRARGASHRLYFTNTLHLPRQV